MDQTAMDVLASFRRAQRRSWKPSNETPVFCWKLAPGEETLP